MHKISSLIRFQSCKSFQYKLEVQDLKTGKFSSHSKLFFLVAYFEICLVSPHCTTLNYTKIHVYSKVIIQSCVPY